LDVLPIGDTMRYFKAIRLVTSFFVLFITTHAQSAAEDNVNSDFGIMDDWNIDGHIFSGVVLPSSPKDRLLAIPGQPSEQPIGYVESQVNIDRGFGDWHFQNQFYFRAAHKKPFNWNDKLEFALPRMNVTYLGENFDIIFGRTNVSAGSAKSTNVIDFFSDNSFLTAFFPGQFDKGQRTGQLAIGTNFIGPDHISFEVYAIPEISAFSFETEPLLSSNQEESYGWGRLSKDFDGGLHLETVVRAHETDWRFGVNTSHAVGDRLVLYSDMLYRNLQPLPEIDADLRSAEFDIENPNAAFAIGGTYVLSARTSFNLETFYQVAGYSKSEKEKLFDLLQSPTNSPYSAVVSELSGDQLLGKHYVYAEAEFLLLIDNLRFIPSVTFAEDGSRRISTRLLYAIDDDGLSLDTRLVGNLGPDRSEFGSKTLGTGLSATLTYRW
jgi:hypothetical protein